MVEITDSLTCLFTAELEPDGDGGYVVSVPKRELEHGTVTAGETYRVAVIDRKATETDTDGGVADTTPTSEKRLPRETEQPSTTSSVSGPPVSEGDVREVTIETLGDKGDGIAKIERGYVVIVPDSKPGDQPTVEITSVRENVSFANVIEE